MYWVDIKLWSTEKYIPCWWSNTGYPACTGG